MSGRHIHETAIDRYAQLTSPLHQWELRLKIISLLTLIIAFALVESIQLIPIMIGITLGIYALSRLPITFLRSRLIVPSYFIIALVIFLPFVAGTTKIATLGSISIQQEGLIQAGLIIGRFFCIFTTALVLISTNSFLNMVRALRGLKFPDIMADMLLLTYRYLFEINTLFMTISTAARLRGFQATLFSPDTIKTITSLAGHLLVRSYEQSQQVYTAMVLRGYGNENIKIYHQKPTTADYVKSAITITIAISLCIVSQVLI